MYFDGELHDGPTGTSFQIQEVYRGRTQHPGGSRSTRTGTVLMIRSREPNRFYVQQTSVIGR